MTETSEKKCVVGYGKPPKHTQFKPGRSGNPKGRPRKTSTFSDEVKAELNSKIAATENGQPKKITKLQLIVKQHVINAIKGNVGSAKMLIDGMKQDQPREKDNLAEMLDAFEERNRQLAYRVAESESLIDLPGNITPTPSDQDHSG
jgi:hypothetical protein